MTHSKLFEVLSRDSCRIKMHMWWSLSIGRRVHRLNTVLIYCLVEEKLLDFEAVFRDGFNAGGQRLSRAVTHRPCVC